MHQVAIVTPPWPPKENARECIGPELHEVHKALSRETSRTNEVLRIQFSLSQSSTATQSLPDRR